MTDLSHLTESDLRRTVRYLLWKCNRFHTAARWLLLICCIEAIVIVCLLVL
jgi:hypothetical protein